jgi:glycerol-3-phosphate acyltransferase PlsY
MMRDNEKEGELSGATWVFVGALFTILLVPYPYSILALLFLSVGDSFAAIIGIKFPLIKVGEKTLSGSAAGFLACIIIGFIVDLSIRYEIVFFGAIMAMVIELIPLPINDNLSIPLFSGSAMYFFSLVL